MVRPEDAPCFRDDRSCCVVTTSHRGGPDGGLGSHPGGRGRHGEVTTPVRAPGTSLERLRDLSHVWDNLIRIPILGRRIGLDAIVGVIPGAGDIVGGALGIYGLLIAARLRVGPAVLLRMLLNIGVDTVVGIIPLLATSSTSVVEQHGLRSWRKARRPQRVQRSSSAAVVRRQRRGCRGVRGCLGYPHSLAFTRADVARDDGGTFSIGDNACHERSRLYWGGIAPVSCWRSPRLRDLESIRVAFRTGDHAHVAPASMVTPAESPISSLTGSCPRRWVLYLQATPRQAARGDPGGGHLRWGGGDLAAGASSSMQALRSPAILLAPSSSRGKSWCISPKSGRQVDTDAVE